MFVRNVYLFLIDLNLTNGTKLSFCMMIFLMQVARKEEWYAKKGNDMQERNQSRENR